MCREAISEQLRYIELAIVQLKKYESQVPEYEKLYPYWLKDCLLVVPKPYAHQKEM